MLTVLRFLTRERIRLLSVADLDGNGWLRFWHLTSRWRARVDLMPKKQTSVVRMAWGPRGAPSFTVEWQRDGYRKVEVWWG